MKVLVLTADLPPDVHSGIGTAVACSAQTLAALGCAVEVLTTRANARVEGVSVTQLQTGSFPGRLRGHAVVHLHSLRLAELAWQLTQRDGSALLYTAHALLDQELETTRASQPWKATQARLFERADYVIFLSAEERSAAIARHPSLAPRSTVLPNGIASLPSRKNKPVGPPQVLFAGRFCFSKGADVAAAAMDHLLGRRSDLHCVFAGGQGEPHCEALIARVVARYPERCTAPGWLPQQAMRSLYERASLLLMPSRYEPFGMVALEAMRVGLPVLGSHIEGLRCLLAEGSGGTTLAGHLPRLWADSVSDLLDDTPRLQQMSSCGPNYVKARYSPEVHGPRYLAVLRKCAALRQCIPSAAGNAAQRQEQARAMWLTDRVVLITGGTRGIGRATALRLAQDRPEHIVLVYALDHEAATTAVAAVQACGVEASAICADVGQEGELRRVFDTVSERHRRLDALVSNAARASFGPLTEVSLRTWQRVEDLNTRAFLLGAQLAAGLMSSGGRIIALSSLGSRECPPGYGALGVAKAAIECLVRYLAVELGPKGIYVNAVCGGFVDTDSTRMLENFNRVSAEIAARTPMGRIAQPEDIASVVALLCQAEANWIQGQTLVADGGYSLRG